MWDLSFLTRDRIHIPCLARQILHHWTTREVGPSRDFCMSSSVTHLIDCIYLLKLNLHNKFIFFLDVLSNATDHSCWGPWVFSGSYRAEIASSSPKPEHETQSWTHPGAEPFTPCHLGWCTWHHSLFVLLSIKRRLSKLVSVNRLKQCFWLS